MEKCGDMWRDVEADFREGWEEEGHAMHTSRRHAMHVEPNIPLPYRNTGAKRLKELIHCLLKRLSASNPLFRVAENIQICHVVEGVGSDPGGQHLPAQARERNLS